MTALRLLLESYLADAGYKKTEDPDYWEHPDGQVDKLIPTIIDCLEREDV